MPKITQSDDAKEFEKQRGQLTELGQWRLAEHMGTMAQDPRDLNPETNRHLRKWLNAAEVSKNEFEFPMKTPEGKYLVDVMRQLYALDLSHLPKKERQKAETAYEHMRGLIREMLVAVREYVKAILDLGAMKENVEDAIAEMVAKDQRRRDKHNKLIDMIGLVNRSLKWWFGGVKPPGDSVYADMYHKQKPKFVAEGLKSVVFGKNGIVSDKYNIADRREITFWAQQIFDDMIDIEKSLQLK